jgi:transposase
MRDPSSPPEVRQLGRTMRTWRTQIAAWHSAQVTNGPTEAMNNLAKRIKRVAFGMTNFRNWRIRVLLYAGRPNWSLLSSADCSPRDPAQVRRAGKLRVIHRRAYGFKTPEAMIALGMLALGGLCPDLPGRHHVLPEAA